MTNTRKSLDSEGTKSTRSKGQETLFPGIYEHYKGGRYRVYETASHSETLERMVVYRCLYGDKGLWVRPLSMFLETIEIDDEKGRVPRFRLLEKDEVSL